MTAVRFSITQQIWAINEVKTQRVNGYPKLVSRGKLRQAEADHRIGAVQAAIETLVDLDYRQRHAVLAPAQIDMLQTWIAKGREIQERRGTNPQAPETDTIKVGEIEAIALGRLLRDLAFLAGRKDMDDPR